MKSLADLQTDIAINNSCFDGEIEVGADEYPDNDWGIMLAHFDSCVAVYRHAKVETKNQGLQQDYVSSQAKDENDGDWQAWNEDNPNIPNILHNPVIFEASMDASAYTSEH